MAKRPMNVRTLRSIRDRWTIDLERIEKAYNHALNEMKKLGNCHWLYGRPDNSKGRTLMIYYVVGFAFWRDRVLLIHKRKGPSYVLSKLNGVGGKIETGEFPVEAMVREFREETGIDTVIWNWRPVAEMQGEDYTLHIFCTNLSDLIDYSKIENPEDTGENLEWFPIDESTSMNYNRVIVPNLKWIIPLCLDTTTPYLEITERHD